jgi:hypothetical protein
MGPTQSNAIAMRPAIVVEAWLKHQTRRPSFFRASQRTDVSARSLETSADDRESPHIDGKRLDPRLPRAAHDFIPEFDV